MSRKYRSRSARHEGWRVEVTKATRQAVWFRLLSGPGHSRGKVFRLSRVAFEAGFEPVTKGR